MRADRPLGVFYNPKMSLNRDLAILFAKSHFSPWKKLRVCDMMTASGVRAVRYALECRNALKVVAADILPAAVEFARDNVRFNGLEGKITILESDADNLLQNVGQERFDIVDLDPFGSPAPFFESALRATVDQGVLAATATDMGPLSGARRAACRRKYGVEPVSTEFEKEFAVRALVASLAQAACKLGLGVSIAFSQTTDHYARVCAQVSKGNTAANSTIKMIGYLEYCKRCLNRRLKNALNRVDTKCAMCGARVCIAGPLWTDHLWQKETIVRMVNNTPTLESSQTTRIQQILLLIQEELDGPPLYYRTDALASALRIKPPGIQHLLSSLREIGFTATRTHFSTNGIRTDASIAQLANALNARLPHIA